MALFIGIVLYVFVGTLILAFGRFLKECDNSMSQGMKKETGHRRRRRNPALKLSLHVR